MPDTKASESASAASATIQPKLNIDSLIAQVLEIKLSEKYDFQLSVFLFFTCQNLLANSILYYL